MNLNKLRKTFNTRYTKIGGYGAVLTAIVLAIVIIINLLINQLPSTLTKYDTTSSGFFTISDKSKEIIKNIKSDITIYLIAESGSEDTQIKELAARYTALNGKIKFKKVDPAVQPGFTSAYTDETLNQNSLIVVNNDTGRSTCIDNSSIYVTEYSDEELYYYYLYGQTPSGTTSFAGESAITSALDYVTAEKLPKMYILTGNGESELGETLSGRIKKDNIETEQLSLINASEVPADADIILIHVPTYDLSENETNLLSDYISAGGHVIAVTGFASNSFDSLNFPNLFKLTSSFGLEYSDGLVLEGTSNNYYQAPYYCIPKVASNSFSSRLTSNATLVCIMPHGILESETTPEGITVSSLLSSTATAYAKTDIAEDTTIEKAEGDKEGPFMFGAMAEREDGGSLIWFSCADFLNDSLSTSFANSDYFLSVIATLTNKAESVSIASKPMQVAALVVNDMAANIWGAVFIFIVPAAVLIGGLSVWVSRRKR
ncbi:MAG: Gldg family protein [Firmicutes bacterium]|nr:Gldg family protein [Bacillota bacterium]